VGRGAVAPEKLVAEVQLPKTRRIPRKRERADTGPDFLIMED
jgi:hypothetical protein